MLNKHAKLEKQYCRKNISEIATVDILIFATIIFRTPHSNKCF